jgi:nucleoside-diphosphate-sugar epimerase
VDDVVTANILSVINAQNKPQTINIGTGEQTSVIQLLQVIQSCLPNLEFLSPIHQPPRAGDVLHSQANIRKAESYLSYKPQVSLKEGIQRTIEWFNRQ